MFMSDTVIVPAELSLMIQNILQAYAVQIMLYGFGKTFPDIQRRTERRALTVVELQLQTGNGCKAAFGCAENIPDRAFLRGLRKHISAAVSAVCAENAALVQHRNNLFQIFFRNILVFRDFL